MTTTVLPDEARPTPSSDPATPDPAGASPAADAPAVPTLHDQVIEALKGVYDPEIPVNIYDLGLIYRVDLVAPGTVEIDMTLTAPSCPVAGHMPGMVQSMVSRVEGIEEVTVELVWEPPWTPERMSEEAKLELGFW